MQRIHKALRKTVRAGMKSSEALVSSSLPNIAVSTAMEVSKQALLHEVGRANSELATGLFLDRLCEIVP